MSKFPPGLMDAIGRTLKADTEGTRKQPSSTRSIANVLGVGKSTVNRWDRKRARTSGCPVYGEALGTAKRSANRALRLMIENGFKTTQAGWDDLEELRRIVDEIEQQVMQDYYKGN